MLSNGAFDQLKAYYLFLLPSMSEATWQRFERALTHRVVKKGAFILREGQKCDQVSFINRGLVRKFYHIDGKEKIICFFNDNSYIADYSSFLTRRPAQINIHALTETELVETSYDNLQALYREVPEANVIGRIIAENIFIRMNDDKEAEIKTTIAQRYNTLIREEPWLLQNVPQYMIASYLGVTPEALSRVKARIKKVKQPELVAR